MRKMRWLGAGALLLGIVGIAVEVLQIILYDTHLSMEWCYPANSWNYLAFFTVITNLTVDLWLVLLGISILFKFARMKHLLINPAIQGALVTYIATVGVVYCCLLFWFIGPYSMALWWANAIDMWNHLILPLAMITLWVLMERSRASHGKLRKITLLYWMIWPILYLILSEIRGLVWDWYPYPFLRPSWIMFPLGIVVTSGCFVAAGALIIWRHNKLIHRHACPIPRDRPGSKAGGDV
jgi:hypothetical protein